MLKAMAPVFDMFNHDPLSSTVHGFQEVNQCLHLVTLQDWRAGSEVRFCYGPLSNSRLLLLHGFCVPDNPFDAVELWATMEDRAPRYAEKMKVPAAALCREVLEEAFRADPARGTVISVVSSARRNALIRPWICWRKRLCLSCGSAPPLRRA